MKLVSYLFLFVLVLASLANCQQSHTETVYKPTVESLSSHTAPQWYTDAKFGIFIHWGVYSVPAYHEWYLPFMSPKSSFGRNAGGPPYTAAQGNLSDSVFHANIQEEANEYQRKNYGVNFAYDDFIPMFKAEHFNPDKWATLFKQSGAKYVVLTAKHGDEFALWPTKYTKRNAMEMGPHRDLVGDLTKAVRSQNIKMGYYHNTTYSFWDKRYPSKEWVKYMNNSIKELVDMYHPDILWGDVVVGPAHDKNEKPLGAGHWNSKEVISYFYNHSKNPDQVLTNDRWGVCKATNITSKMTTISGSVWSHYVDKWGLDSDNILLGDFQSPERRNTTKIIKGPWETCDSLDPTSWGYNRRTPDTKYMTSNELVDYLSDIVSKGGNLIINIGPKADGTIPKVMQVRLQDIGSWLKVNGEAIYGSSPWTTYGEGPTKGELGSWGREDGKYQFKAGDVRFTRKGDVLYAIILEWPSDNEITLKNLKKVDINQVTMLGSNKNIQWEKTSGGIHVSLPSKPISPFANTLKLVCEEL